jgi:hypothetical protein
MELDSEENVVMTKKLRSRIEDLELELRGSVDASEAPEARLEGQGKVVEEEFEGLGGGEKRGMLDLSEGLNAASKGSGSGLVLECSREPGSVETVEG